MQRIILVALVGLAASAQVTPIEKVIQLLNDAASKGKAEMQAEKVNFAKFDSWCGSTIGETQDAIAKEEADMAEYKGTHEKNVARSKKLAAAISEGNHNVAKLNNEKKISKKDFALDFKILSKRAEDLTRAVDALKKAHGVIKNSQVKNKVEAGKASAYKATSGGVLDLVRNMRMKFEDELQATHTEIANTQNNHRLEVQDIDNQVKSLNDQVAADEANKATAESDAATAKSNFESTEAEHKDDSQYLKDTQNNCKIKSRDFAARQKLREEEIVAIQKAVDILGSDDVSGAGGKHLPSLLQTSMGSAHNKIVALLNEKAAELKSRNIADLALLAAQDPFIKIRQMIQDLIARLMREAAKDADQQGFCVKEHTRITSKQEHLKSELSRIKTRINKNEATIDKLNASIDDNTKAIADLDASMAQASSIRAEERADNEQTIEDAQKAQVAVEKATGVLREFYTKSGGATQLMQKKEREAPPQTFDDTFKGDQQGNTSIIGILEVILEDFVRLEKDTTSAENKAQEDHDKFMKESTNDKAEKTAKLNADTAQRNVLKSENGDLADDEADTQSELNDHNEQFEALRPQCFPDPVPFHVREAARQSEITALKEVQGVLEELN